MNEQLFLGECPVVRPEGIYYEGKRVIRFGLQGVGVGDVGDLLAYRQEWESYIMAHRALWQYLNELFENVPEAKQCPAGIFNYSQIQSMSSTMQSFCASLSLTRTRASDTDPGGILAQWNAWQNKSSAEIVAGAATMLQWHQDVVMRVGNQYKNELLDIAKFWDLKLQLPDVPTFTSQQEIIARIEGAYITTKGILQLVGYGAGDSVMLAANVTQAVADGLTEAAKEIPKTTSHVLALVGVTAVLVGGVLIAYYHPRKARAAA